MTQFLTHHMWIFFSMTYSYESHQVVAVHIQGHIVFILFRNQLIESEACFRQACITHGEFKNLNQNLIWKTQNAGHACDFTIFAKISRRELFLK
jgi:hypothetical protein